MPATRKKTPARAPRAAPKAPAARTRTARPPARTPPSTAAAIRFEVPAALLARTLAVLAKVEKSRTPGEHRDELFALIASLNEAGTSWFFLRPLQLAKAGFAVTQLAGMSMAANNRLVASAIRTVMGRLDDRQLLSVCKYIRQLMA